MSHLTEEYTLLSHIEEIRAFPHTCPTLWILIQRKNVKEGSEILKHYTEYQNWLLECVAQNDNPNFYWSHGRLTTKFRGGDGVEKYFANILRFKYKEDLLAFKLKFGMHESVK